MQKPLGQARQSLAVLVDFDGTMTHASVGEVLLDAFGSPLWRKEAEHWKAGAITFGQLIQREFTYLPAAKRDEMVRFALERVQFRDGIDVLWAVCAQNAVPFEVVSGGLDFYIRPLLAKHGLGSLPLTSMQVTEPGGIGMSPMYPAGIVACDAIGVCKCARLSHYKSRGLQTIYVGDGDSDRCVAKQADILFARDALARYCQEQGIAFTPFETFHEVTAFLKRQMSATPS